MKKSLTFRSWYYFRQGWSMYFAFLFAAVNTLTVTYYLAIEKAPSLKTIFPSFIQYVAIITFVGVPILILLGYMHFKKSSAFKSETNVVIESNPFQRRMVVNTEILVQLNLQLLGLLIKSSKNEKLDDNELAEITKLQNHLTKLIQERTLDNNKDLTYLNNIDHITNPSNK